MPAKAIWVLKNEGPKKFSKKTAKKTASILGIQKRTKFTKEYDFLANPVFQITEKDILDSSNAAKRRISKISSALWFVPYFDHITYG
jgi:hypothetical protein